MGLGQFVSQQWDDIKGNVKFRLAEMFVIPVLGAIIFYLLDGLPRWRMVAVGCVFVAAVLAAHYLTKWGLLGSPFAKIVKRTPMDGMVCEEIKVDSGRLVELLAKEVKYNGWPITEAINRLESNIAQVRGDQAFTQAIRDFSHFCRLFADDDRGNRLSGRDRVDRRQEMLGLFQTLDRERERFLSGVNLVGPSVARR